MSQSGQTHWEAVYREATPVEHSWYQEIPRRSLELIHLSGTSRDAPVLDVGGGDATLVDHLLKDGFTDVTVLDLAAVSLARARERLGAASRDVQWLAADVLEFRPARKFALWHDRAVFHFLRDPDERARYLAVLREALAPGGFVILATFGPDGPTRCSGLAVQCYSADALSDLLGSSFELRRQLLEDHTTPRGTRQQFLYGLWKQHVPKV